MRSFVGFGLFDGKIENRFGFAPVKMFIYASRCLLLRMALGLNH